MRLQKNIKLIVLDVDGVLTDGKLLIGSDGTEYKAFNVKDGMGISMAHFYGIKVAIITGRESRSVNIRAQELKIKYLYEGITNKLEVLKELTDSLALSLDEVVYMGDDINDLAVIQSVGYSAAPKDAVGIIKETVDFVSQFSGGNGAVRETIEMILKQQIGDHNFPRDYLKKKIGMIQ